MLSDHIRDGLRQNFRGRRRRDDSFEFPIGVATQDPVRHVPGDQPDQLGNCRDGVEPQIGRGMMP